MVSTYNARDQITQIRQYAGPEGSGTYQDTITTYDNYGRLKTRHLPEQNAATATTWDYNPDDTVQKITDARGASQTYTYNNRHLPTGITSAWPGGGPVPGPISYVYDAAGNRTSMTDDTGSVTYHFDELSRMDWEERTFAGLYGSIYRLSYGYNLAGQLTSLSEPSQFGSNVTYSYDAAGRTSSVTGSGFAGGVTQLASNMKYRAWGALWEMDYGNGLRLSNAFNSRMQVNNYKVKVPGTPEGQGEYARSDYEYHPDGQIKNAFDRTNPGFDRSYGYDHVGRLNGAAASNWAFAIDMGFDPFGNMIQRSTFSWRAYHTFTSQYQNNRNIQTTSWVPPGAPQTNYWTYDFDGRVTHDHNKEYTFDAAGSKTRVFETTQINPTLVKRLWIYQDYDGNGARAKRVEQEQINSAAYVFVTSYYLRSSVLNGKVITELNEFGQRRETNVYANGMPLAQQKDNQVRWQHLDPITDSHRETALGGMWISHLEFDPMGNDAPLVDPQPPEAPPAYEYTGNYGNNGNPYDGPSGCMVDGQQVPCSLLMRLLTLGTGKSIGGTVTSLQQIWVDEWEEVETPPGTGSQGSDANWTGSVTVQIRNVGRFATVSTSQGTTNIQQLPPPKFDIPGIRKGLQEALKRWECREFIQDLLEAAMTKKNPLAESGHIMTFFETVVSQGNFTREKPKRSAGFGNPLGRVRDKNAGIYLMGSAKHQPEVLLSFDTEGALHEIMHLAGANVYYSDAQFANIVHDIMDYRNLARLPFPLNGADEKTRKELLANPGDTRWGAYWGDLLRQKCFPNR